MRRPAMSAAHDTMADARAALREVVPEFVRLVRGIPDPNAAAVGTWRVGDVAAHVSHVCGVDRDALAGTRTLPTIAVNTASVAELTAAMLADDSERDPAALAHRIVASADEFDDVADHCRADTVTWLGGARLAPSAVACHLLEEFLVHGHDIARAGGRPWPIQRRHAVLAIEGAALPIIAALPTSFVNSKRVGSFGARIDIRLRGGGSTQLALDGGSLRVGQSDGRTADAHVSADPATLLLVLLGRRRIGKPLLTGKLVGWGRRPQKLLQLLEVLSPP
jgi:hypothetical protein